MAETRKLIKSSRELKEEIARKLNVTTRTVDAALAYDTNSPTARIDPLVCPQPRSKALRTEGNGKPLCRSNQPLKPEQP